MKPTKTKDAPMAQVKQQIPQSQEQNIVAMPSQPAKPKTRPQKKRRWALWTSMVFLVLLPGIMGTWYWLFQAPDRYVSEAGFTIRSIDEGFNADMLSSLTGLSGNT